jgi:hypothetical protein
MTAPTLSDHEALVRYLERQFHRVSNERYALRFWSWFWFGAAAMLSCWVAYLTYSGS